MRQLLVGFIKECIQTQTRLSLQSGSLIVPLTAPMRAMLQNKLAGSSVKSVGFITDGFDITVSRRFPIIGELDFTLKFRAFEIRRDGGDVKIRFRLDSYKFIKYVLPLLTSKLESNQMAIAVENNCWTIDVGQKVVGMFKQPWQDAEELKPFVEKLFFSTAVTVSMLNNSIVIKPRLRLDAEKKQILLDFIESAII
ncbi:MAG: hypothetical protein WCV63_08780 [Negativicutes bacterium]